MSLHRYLYVKMKELQLYLDPLTKFVVNQILFWGKLTKAWHLISKDHWLRLSFGEQCVLPAPYHWSWWLLPPSGLQLYSQRAWLASTMTNDVSSDERCLPNSALAWSCCVQVPLRWRTVVLSVGKHGKSISCAGIVTFYAMLFWFHLRQLWLCRHSILLEPVEQHVENKLYQPSICILYRGFVSWLKSLECNFVNNPKRPKTN